jgi:hypothetical protein
MPASRCAAVGASGVSTTRETNFSWNGPKPIASSSISTLGLRRRTRAAVHHGRNSG